MDNDIQLLLQEIDDLIKKAEDGEDMPSDEVVELLAQISDDLTVIKEKKKTKASKTLIEKIDKLVEVNSKTKDESNISTAKIIEALSKLSIIPPAPVVNVSPPEVKVTVPEMKAPEVNVSPPTIVIPDEINIKKPTWLESLIDLTPLYSLLQNIKNAIPQKFTLPTDAKDAIPVRLSDGEKFYRALGGMASAVASSFPFKTANNEQAAALVDDQGVVQVKVQGIDIGDVEIGAVEIKDSSSDNRVSVTAHGTGYALDTHTPDITLTDTITGLNDYAEMQLKGMGSCVCQVSGTWTGKVEFQGAIDGVWNTLSIFQPTGAITRNGIQNDNQNGLYRIVITSGYTKIRAILTSWSAGSVDIMFNASTPVGSSQVWQLNAANLNTTIGNSTGASAVNIQDGGNTITVDGTVAATQSGTWNVNNVSGTVSLPTGASTEAKQDTGNTSLASIKTNTDLLAPLTAIYSGTKTVPTGTAEAIAGSQAIKSVTIKSLSTNTVAIYVGPSGVTTSSGFELLAGESVTLDVSNTNLPYVISGSASQVIRYIAV